MKIVNVKNVASCYPLIVAWKSSDFLLGEKSSLLLLPQIDTCLIFLLLTGLFSRMVVCTWIRQWCDSIYIFRLILLTPEKFWMRPKNNLFRKTTNIYYIHIILDINVIIIDKSVKYYTEETLLEAIELCHKLIVIDKI